MKCPHKGLAGACFHCKYWNDKKHKMVCVVYPAGIPENMWEKDADGNLIYHTQSMDEASKTRMRELEQESGLIGHCFMCRNSYSPVRWNEKTYAIICEAFPKGASKKVMKSLEEHGYCYMKNKSRAEMEYKKAMKKIEEINRMDIPDDEKVKLHEKWLEKQSKD